MITISIKIFNNLKAAKECVKLKLTYYLFVMFQ